MEQKSKQKNLYWLLDSRYVPIARGLLLSTPNAPNWQLQVLEDKISAVMEHQTIQLVSLSDRSNDLVGRVVRRREDCVILEPILPLGHELRENVRIRTSFSSLIYPLTGAWRGQRKITAHDISCGGIAFYCQESLEIDEQLEVVVPITRLPLILTCQVLRCTPFDQNTKFYASKFLDLCHDEEKLVRASVFNIQVMERARAMAASKL
jgi:hypothetical protein